MEVRQAPKFIRIAGSEVKSGDNSMRLLFLAEDGQHYAIEIDNALSSALVMTITGHANELVSIHGGETVQAMPIKRMDVSMTTDGNTGLKLTSESDLQTVLSFRPEDASKLRDALRELDDLLSRRIQ